MTSPEPAPTRCFSWNGLSCTTPADWEATVKGPTHLIFEQRLQPILELRWDPAASRLSPEKRIQTIFSRLQRESGGALLPLKQPEIAGTLPEGWVFMVYGRGATRAEGLIAACVRCATPLLIRFFEPVGSGMLPAVSFIQSLSCSNCQPGEQRWSIQDISFTVPEEFSLDTFSFDFGLSRVSFNSPHSRLEYCRLAPASEHLREASLSELFAVFCNCAPDGQTVINERELSARTKPAGLIERIRNKLKRNRGYQLAYFNHVPGRDRILGTRLESGHEPNQKWFSQLCTNHALVS